MLDTIAALATAPGKAGVAVIRLSGGEAKRIAQTLISAPLTTPRHVYYRTIPQIDHACVIYFEGPASFTGEDVIEFHTHSGSSIIQKLLTALYQHGARAAHPGEFTQRAVMNGKIDLTQAEGIADLIDAAATHQHHVALSHVSGSLYNWITSLKDTLIPILEQVEGSIDFPDEVPAIDRQTVTTAITSLQKDLTHTLSLQDYGEKIQSGIKVLIVGKPNAGKSSLLNTLVGHERAIVTDIPGTTRDYLTADIELGGLQFQLIDSAGYRDTQDKVEQLGIAQLTPLFEACHAIVWLIDKTATKTEDDTNLEARITQLQKPTIVLETKADVDASAPQPTNWPVYNLSTTTKEGIPELKQWLIDTFQETISDHDLGLICNARQKACLLQLQSQLTTLQTNLAGHLEDDCLAIDLKQAVQTCAELTGHALTEKVLDGVFSRFCVGK